METWASRAVIFTPFPRQADSEWDGLFEGLADHYYGANRFTRRYIMEPVVSSCERVISVDGFPWWMPRRWALRSVAKLAIKHGVGGTARYEIERTVLR